MTANEPPFKEGDFHRLLARTHRAHAKRAFSELAGIGISNGQPRVLHYLCEHDGCIQRDISDAFELEPATVTEILAVMERNGLVTRKRDPSDRRVLKVFITPKGKRTHVQVEEIFTRVEIECFEGFTPAEKAKTVALLTRVLQNTRNGSCAERKEKEK